MRRWGASALQCGHQVAKNSSSTALPRYCARLTLWPCGVFSVNPGARFRPAAGSGSLVGERAEAGWLSITPTPGSYVGWKPTALAARISPAGAFRSEALGVAGGAVGGVEVDLVAIRTMTATAMIATSEAVASRARSVAGDVGCCFPTGGGVPRVFLLIVISPFWRVLAGVGSR